MLQRIRKRSRCRACSGIARPHLADVVLVFRNIGKMGEIAEGANDTNGLADRHAVENGLELAPGQAVFVAMKPDRGLPYALDQVEYIVALLITHGIAQDAPEQPDIVAQPGVFLER
jgi:hypothetical protein